MVTSGLNAGGGHCGGPAWTASHLGRQTLLPFEDAKLNSHAWACSRAQQQLLWDTLESLKDKAAQAFTPADVSQPLDPFRETYSDGGLFGASCNYAVGFHGIQGRQPKCEDYVLHLALGPDLFTPFDDCTRACLACVLDGHCGTGAVQYVAERFPSYLLEDLPRLRAQPAAAMRSALHRIDEELTALGHNSGTTVNALLMVDNRVTVVNTGDCRCILYDWVEERTVQVTHDHNLHSSRERERVVLEGAELSGCGGYVVLPCPTDGAKLLGVTKALGHAGVKALQRSVTMGSLSGILEGVPSPGLDPEPRQPQSAKPGVLEPATVSSLPAPPPSLCSFGRWSVTTTGRTVCEGSSGSMVFGRGSGAAHPLVSGSGMSDDFPVMPAARATGAEMGACLQPDVDMCSSCSARALQCLHPAVAGSESALVAAKGTPDRAGILAGRGDEDAKMLKNSGQTTVSCAPELPGPAPQRCSSYGPAGPHGHRSSFATAAGAAVAAEVAACPEPLVPTDRPDIGTAPSLTGAGTGGSFVLTCEPDEFEFTVEDDRHMILLGCDGVFDRMSNAEACKTALRQLSSSNSCVDAAREVVHRACRLGSLDNITALVLRLGRKPIVRRQSFSVLSLRRTSSNTSGDLAASGGSLTSR